MNLEMKPSDGELVVPECGSITNTTPLRSLKDLLVEVSSPSQTVKLAAMDEIIVNLTVRVNPSIIK